MIKCKQCQELKQETDFRKIKKTGSDDISCIRKTCLDCERINNKFKYLQKKDSLSEDESSLKERILNLYTTQKELGGAVPSYDDTKDILDTLNLAAENAEERLLQNRINRENMFTIWLEKSNEELYEDEYTPDYLFDKYTSLKKEFKPIIGYTEDHAPIYADIDEKFDNLLKQLSEKFEAYEEYYDEKEFVKLED